MREQGSYTSNNKNKSWSNAHCKKYFRSICMCTYVFMYRTRGRLISSLSFRIFNFLSLIELLKFDSWLLLALYTQQKKIPSKCFQDTAAVLIEFLFRIIARCIQFTCVLINFWYKYIHIVQSSCVANVIRMIRILTCDP